MPDRVPFHWFTATAGGGAHTGYATASRGARPEPPGVPTAFPELAHDIGTHARASAIAR